MAAAWVRFTVLWKPGPTSRFTQPSIGTTSSGGTPGPSTHCAGRLPTVVLGTMVSTGVTLPMASDTEPPVAVLNWMELNSHGIFEPSAMSQPVHEYPAGRPATSIGA